MLAIWEYFWASDGWGPTPSNSTVGLIDFFKSPFGYSPNNPNMYCATAAPISGAIFKQGDIVFNRTPSAGGAAFWVCVSVGPVWRAVNCAA